MRAVERISLALIAFVLLTVSSLYYYAKWQRERETTYLSALKQTLTVASGSFPPNGDMPLNCTCKGQELSPALTWEGSLSATQSFVVLTTDYDAPTPALPIFNITHWIVYNLPASVRSLPEGVTTEQIRRLGGRMGENVAGDPTYVGPCPPLGRHAYVFRVFALDNTLSFSGLPDRSELMAAMKGHILNYGELKGYFQ